MNKTINLIKEEILDKQQRDEHLIEIHARVNRDTFWNLGRKGQMGYLNGNQTASYPNTQSYYLITKGAKKFLTDIGYDLSKPLTRNSLHSIRDENGKKILTYEHMIPSKVITDKFREMYEDTGNITIKEVQNILDMCKVTIMLQTENTLINQAGYKSQMPKNCNIEKNPEIRYEMSGVELSNTNVRMYGAIKR